MFDFFLVFGNAWFSLIIWPLLRSNMAAPTKAIVMLCWRRKKRSYQITIFISQWLSIKFHLRKCTLFIDEEEKCVFYPSAGIGGQVLAMKNKLNRIYFLRGTPLTRALCFALRRLTPKRHSCPTVVKSESNFQFPFFVGFIMIQILFIFCYIMFCSNVFWHCFK